MQTAETTRENVSLEGALREAEETYIAGNPESQRYFTEATGSMPGGNTRTVLHFDPFPLTFVDAEGAYVTDADGHRLLDLMGEYTAGLYGHSEPAIEQAVISALKKGIVLSGPNSVEAKFAQALCDRLPAIERIRFCNSGTEANVYALSAARAFTGRDEVIVMENGYHGGVLYFAGDCPLNLPMPFHRTAYNDAAAAARLIRERGNRLAAVILEPMLGGGGCFPATAEFLRTLREETEAVGALLIFDEVMTSRLAPGGLHGQHGLRPDLVTLGKYLGGGLTFGAFGGREDIMARFDPRSPDAWPHAGTFNNNILTMAAGYAGLTQVLSPEAMASLNAKGDLLRSELSARMQRLDLPVKVTGLGSMTAYHFCNVQPTSPADLPAVPSELKAFMHLDLLAKSHYIARRGMINLSLPMTETNVLAFADAFEDAIAVHATLIRNSVPA
jgi:glutamate-1-semialdehyde 2,1-aminomutase